MNTAGAKSRHEVVIPRDFNLDDLPVRVGQFTIRRGDAEAFKAMLREVVISKYGVAPSSWPQPKADRPEVT